MRYRKRPVVIEAVVWNGKYLHPPEWPEWFRSGVDAGVLFTTAARFPKLVIKTLEGDMEAEVGDFVICGIKGELYPCKPDIFAASYEVA